jgi:hypothetical protein
MAEKKSQKSKGKATETGEPADPKEKFRQALQRKKDQHAASLEGGGGAGGSEHGKPDTHAHGAKRQFRRKSGG